MYANYAKLFKELYEIHDSIQKNITDRRIEICERLLKKVKKYNIEISKLKEIENILSSIELYNTRALPFFTRGISKEELRKTITENLDRLLIEFRKFLIEKKPKPDQRNKPIIFNAIRNYFEIKSEIEALTPHSYSDAIHYTIHSNFVGCMKLLEKYYPSIVTDESYLSTKKYLDYCEDYESYHIDDLKKASAHFYVAIHSVIKDFEIDEEEINKLIDFEIRRKLKAKDEVILRLEKKLEEKCDEIFELEGKVERLKRDVEYHKRAAEFWKTRVENPDAVDIAVDDLVTGIEKSAKKLGDRIDEERKKVRELEKELVKKEEIIGNLKKENEELKKKLEKVEKEKVNVFPHYETILEKVEKKISKCFEKISRKMLVWEVKEELESFSQLILQIYSVKIQKGESIDIDEGKVYASILEIRKKFESFSEFEPLPEIGERQIKVLLNKIERYVKREKGKMGIEEKLLYL